MWGKLSAIIVITLLATGGASAQQLSRVEAGTSEKINKHSECKVVVNGGSNDMMVPYKHRDEWSSSSPRSFNKNKKNAKGVKADDCPHSMWDIRFISETTGTDNISNKTIGLDDFRKNYLGPRNKLRTLEALTAHSRSGSSRFMVAMKIGQFDSGKSLEKKASERRKEVHSSKFYTPDGDLRTLKKSYRTAWTSIAMYCSDYPQTGKFSLIFWYGYKDHRGSQGNPYPRTGQIVRNYSCS